MGTIDDIDYGDLMEPSAEEKEAEKFLYELEQLIDEEHVQYARDTLEGIMETVRERMFVTPNQRRAVENIDEGGQRHQRRRY